MYVHLRRELHCLRQQLIVAGIGAEKVIIEEFVKRLKKVLVFDYEESLSQEK